MKINTILEKLKYNNNNIIPREALIEARNNKELIIPELLKILDYATENIETIVKDENYIAHIYAMLLLAEFKEKSAFPHIIKFFSIPGSACIDVKRGLELKAIGRILTSVYGGSLKHLKLLIENEEVVAPIRSACIISFIDLVAVDHIVRTTAIKYFKELFTNKLERRFSGIWSELINSCNILNARRLLNDIKSAYHEGLVDSFTINFKTVEDNLKKGKEYSAQILKDNEDYGFVTDVIKEAENLEIFSKNINKKLLNGSPKNKTTIINKDETLGRNDPCICGSGKKYKKCCLNK